MKVKILAWLIMLGKLHKKEKVAEKCVITHGFLCCLCSDSDETHDHLFLQCPMLDPLGEAFNLTFTLEVCQEI